MASLTLLILGCSYQYQIGYVIMCLKHVCEVSLQSDEQFRKCISEQNLHENRVKISESRPQLYAPTPNFAAQHKTALQRSNETGRLLAKVIRGA